MLFSPITHATCFSPSIIPHHPSLLTALLSSPPFSPHRPSLLTALLSSPPFSPHHPSLLTTLLSSPPFSPHHPSLLTTLLSSPPFSPHHPSLLITLDPSITSSALFLFNPLLFQRPFHVEKSMTNDEIYAMLKHSHPTASAKWDENICDLLQRVSEMWQ